VRVQARERRERPVRRPVVDEDHLPGLAERVERGLYLVVEEGHAALFIVHRDDDGDHRQGIIPAAWPS
jgi:hypothetical protein